MTKPKIIRGSGGGGSPPPPPQPTRTPDTLHSRQFATFLDLVSEGEIEGYATASKEGRTKGTTAYNNAALKDVILNDTPVLKATADSTNPVATDFNFQDVTFNPRFGTSSQTKVEGIESSSSVTAVGVTVTTSSPVTRQITNTDVDAANVTITFPQIQQATDKGDLLGSTVELKISVQYNSGGFTDLITDTITGRTADAYQRDYRIELTGAFPVDIRVSRVTADSTDSALINAFEWTSLGEIIDDANTYANSAYAAIRLDSMQFSSIPSRKYRIRGVKVRIPAAGANGSGTPTVDSATGRIIYPDGYIFNGVLSAATWCSCPAMILLDLLTNTRYGFGDHITDSSLDLFSFVTASKFANTLVDDGLGGQEARFSCNVNIQGSGEAFDLINELAGVMRCMPIWTAGSISLKQDSPATASYLFNLSNITSDGFSYSGSSLKQRHSVVSVSYFNMDTQEIDFEVVEDANLISKLGSSIKQVKAFACTSRGQAARLGRAILFSEANETEVCTFTTSIDSGVVVRPSSIIEIADPVRSGLRRGGRIASVTSTSVITVDDSTNTDLPTTNNAKLSVIMPDGTVETKDISSVSGATITVASPFSQAPNVNTNWLLADDTVQPQLFRVVNVEEIDEINYAITALSYVNEKYAFIEDGSSLPTRTVSILNELKNAPAALQAEEKIVEINNSAVSKLIVSWQPIVGVTQYQVNYRFNNGNFVSTTVSSPDFEIFNTDVGTYEFQVFSYNAALQTSATSADLTFNAVGKTALPSNVTGLTAEPINEKLVRLRWNISTDIDVTHGGRVFVRHSPLTDGSGSFTNSTDLIQALAGNTTSAEVPYLEGEYILKFQDDGGRFCAGETSVIIDLPDNQAPLITQTRREDTDSPKFQGTKVNVEFDPVTNSLNLSGTGLFDAITDFDTVPSLDDFGGIASSGTYDFGGTAGGDTLDLGGVFSLDLKRHFLTEAFYPNDLIDSRLANIDTWTDFDGLTATEVNAEMLVRVTQDDPSGSPTYSDFQTFANGTYKGRGFQFRAKLTSNDVAQDIKVSQLGYTASLQRRTEQGNVIASGAGAKAVTFTNPFFVGTSSLLGANTNLPSIGINAQNMASGDYFEVSSISGTGFTVHFKNSSNASIDRNFTYQAVGFGKGG
jgi:predicted phage tail protein